MNNLLYKALLDHKDPSKVEGLMRFFKTGNGQYGYGDKFLGINVPITRRLVKENWRLVSFDNLQECIESKYHEIRLSALLALIEKFKIKDSQKRCIDFYLSNTEYINNWDLVDLSCYKLLGEWLIDKDRSLLYDFARNGKTIWENRIGIVSTMAFIRKGELKDTFNIADILLFHNHDLIQKAVGWLLREAGKRDKKALLDFLEHRYHKMPRTMLRYSIERFSKEERSAFFKTDIC